MLCPFRLGDNFCRAKFLPSQTCDKTFLCCRMVFNNELHYGGYPTENHK